MTQLRTLLQAAGLRTGEYAQLFYERRAALDHVAKSTSLYGFVPARDRHGYRAQVTLLGRDGDGHMRAEIRVSAHNLVGEYVRRVRLVKREPLPYGLD